MATLKIINTYYGSYDIANGTNLYITGAGSVGGSGILADYNCSITNDGFVDGHNVGGIGFRSGGSLINGSVTYNGATVEGVYGVAMIGGAGFVRNFGLIQGVSSIYGSGDGIDLGDGGSVVNGSAADHYAVVQGYDGIVIAAGGGAVTNFGLIRGLANRYGVQMQDGGSVTNGTNRDSTATIEGYTGVAITDALGAVTNYGTINGLGSSPLDRGVYLSDGGTVINGTGTDRTALIEGGGGVAIAGAAGTVGNAGTILATANAFGVEMIAGGTLTNGSATNATALIEGYAGLYMVGGSASNFGTILGAGNVNIGVRLDDGAAITNGSVGHTAALIEGYVGVFGPGASATVTNFGTIEGEAEGAILFESATDVLNVEAGSTFIGGIYGGGGTLDLASGTGTIANLGAAALTVSGSMAATTFQNFDTVEAGVGATFTDAAALTLAATQVVNSAGTLTLGAAGKSVTSAGLIETTGTGLLTIAGGLKNTGTIAADGGTLTVKGAVTGTGGVGRIDGGTLDLAGAFTQNVTFTGTTGVLELAQSQGYTGDIFGFSKTGKTSLDLLDITFGKSTTATFSGTTAGGILTVTDGTHTAKINLKGNYTTSTFTTSSDGHGGTSVVDPKAKVPALAPAHQFIAAAAGMSGGAGGAPLGVANEAWRASAPALARPVSA